MKRIVHYGYDLTPHVNVENIDYCVLDNIQEPIVRMTYEPFVSYYPVEWCYNVCHRIDPSRSLAKTLLGRLDCGCDIYSKWPTCDIFHYLLLDLGFNVRQPRKYELVAFWTMIPQGVAQLLNESYMKNGSFLDQHRNVVRIINNPFFYMDSNASERRLVEIGTINGFRYAVDRTKIIADPMVLADEITMLNDGPLDNARVLMRRNNLWRSLREVLLDNGLVPEK